MNSSNRHSFVRQILEKTSKDSMAWSIDTVLSGDSCQSLAFLNAHAINNAAKNPDFFHFLMSTNFLLRDGIGVKMAMKLFDLEPGENLNGTDLISKIIPRYKDKSIALFGASIEALEAAKDRLATEENVHSIVSLEHGFHDFSVYFETCDVHHPDIVILCMGMPKQELLAADLIKRQAAKLVICGGGWADFYSGTKKRAPEWVRKCSLEWVYRLLLEPKRLGKRYTIDILFYFYVILKNRFIAG